MSELRSGVRKTAWIVLAGAVVLAACGSSGDSHAKGDMGTTVTEVRLSDGTRCAVMDKANGAAIDCDWRP